MNTFTATGLILKRSNTGELDRVVTVFTKEYGKLVCIAKGSRKLTSSKLATLEPGCLAKLYFVETKSLPILTQAQLIDDFSALKCSLVSIRKFFQVLEMLDVLLPEEDEQQEVFRIALDMISHMEEDESNKTHLVRVAFHQILELLGFDTKAASLEGSMSEQIEELTSRKLKAFAFLSST